LSHWLVGWHLLWLAAALVCCCPKAVQAQRVLGLDISAWQGNISQTTWNNIKNVENRGFVVLRSSRGGTTGYYDQNDSANNNNRNTLSQRYDDPYFVQNVNRATAAGMFVGSYHFTRPDIIATTKNAGGIANTGADEADHFIQMAGAFMRPGYLVPMHDFEAGDGIRNDVDMTQFALDFSNRIYDVMGIRPGIYTNGNYAQNILAGGTSAQRAELAQPNPNAPSMVAPDYTALWSARWPNQSNPNAIDVQNSSPKASISSTYGPFDDYGNPEPWVFWQYASTGRLQSFNNGGSNLDMDVSQGDIEYLKDSLVPAVWMNNSNGDWATLANWNSGQPAIVPATGPGQVQPVGTQTLPTPRLPGAAGSGPTSGQYDTVILERPNANITTTISTGAFNIRKLYMREALEITGGSLTINYNPNYVSDSATYPNALRSGPISAQFSCPVTMTGGSLSVHTLQVDANKTFTLGGGTFTLNTLNLMPLGATPAKLVVSGDVTINPLSGAAAVIQKGAGTGNTPVLDLGGGTRLTVGDGDAATDVTISIPLTGGGLTKAGAGSLALTNANSYTGNTTVEAGKLSLSFPSLPNGADVSIATGATLDLSFATSDVIHALFLSGVSQPAGMWGAVGSGAQFTSPLITGTGVLQVSAFVGTPLGGDFNADGQVNGADLAVWQTNLGLTGALQSQGDANGDGMVDSADFLLWQSQLGQLPSAAAAASAVPEPTSLGLLILGGAMMLRRRATGSRR
jgi:autotransporter-associated beta strand protein